MMIIEVAVRGEDTRREKFAQAMIYGLREQMGASPWKLVASLVDNRGRNYGAVIYTNEGRKPL